MMSETLDPVADLAKALEMSKKIARKVDDLLLPLTLEMKVMKWPPEYQAILWEAVMLEAKRRWEECQ